VCNDTCKEVGEVYRKKRDEQRKIQKTVCTRIARMSLAEFAIQGAKIRSTYIQFAQKEKKRLETVVENLFQQITASEKEVTRLKGISHSLRMITCPYLGPDVADRTESLSQVALEHKQQSRWFNLPSSTLFC
jgi:protein kinase C substrate 80K-H